MFDLCRTFRKNCKFELKLRAADDGKSLQVKSFTDEHNHEVSRVCIIVNIVYICVYSIYA